MQKLRSEALGADRENVLWQLSFEKNANRVLLGGTVGLAIIIGAVVGAGLAVPASADTTDTVEVGASVSDQLFVAVSTDTATMDISAASTLATAGLTVTSGSNNATGHKVMISAEDSDLVNRTVLGTYTLPTLSNTTTTANFPDDKWGYMKDNSGSYLAMPTSNTELISSSTEGSASASLTFGSKVSYATTAGRYQTTVLLTAVNNSNPLSYTLNLDPQNGGSTTTTTLVGTPGTPPVFTLNKPTYGDYQFVGWCDGTVSGNPTAGACNGTVYPAGDYAPNSGVSNKTLYGVWTETIEMQDFTSAYASRMPVNIQIQMRDGRDNKLYTVAKLADGNIWMTQNLDFDIDANETYTSADTNLSANWTPSTSTYTTGTTTWNSSLTSPESYDPGDLCWNGNLNTDWDGTLDTETVACTSSNIQYHIGNYYNWTAAIAMNDSSSYEDDGTIVTQSICPAGWTLPLSGGETGSGSFYYLLNEYGLTSSTTSGSYSIWGDPLKFVLGGDWRGSSSYVASYGFYWSSVVDEWYRAYGLNFNFYGYVNPQDYDFRSVGFSVRCVAIP